MSIDRSQIPGWGADLDRSKRPAVPMERIPNRLEGVPPGEPVRQRQTVEILHSIERPDITPVFGTACPPSGLSGKLRRIAFRRSENDIRHWMMLMFADRVNVVEAMFDDVRKSRTTHSIAIVGLVGLMVAVWLKRA
jgi:hypothetical protein